MKKLRLIYYSVGFILFFLLSLTGLSQQRKISGVVLEGKSNVPLEGATVSVKNSKTNAITKADGKFEINVPDGKNVLIVSFVGYEGATINIGQNQTNVLIKMNESGEKKLGEVVIVGYQRQSLKKTTSAVQIITSKEIENLPAPSFDQLLQGKVAGVNIQNFSGEPGVRNTFVVRGNTTLATDLNTDIDDARTLSTPLYVIDGMPLTITELEGVSSTGTNVLAGININDIESITVQKDAAATAVWGSRGANGVIIIKTKRGRTGKPQVRASFYTGITEKPELRYTLLGQEERYQKLNLLREYGSYGNLGSIPQIITDSLNPAYNGATDWQDLFYKSGIIKNADVSISAGSDLLNYRIGVNYYDEDGIIRNTGFTRYSMRGNFDFKISPKFTTALSFSVSKLNRKRGLGRGRYDVVPISASSQPASFYTLVQADYDFYYGKYDRLRDKNESDITNISLQANYDFFPGFQYTFRGGIGRTTDKRERFQPKDITDDHRSFASNDNSQFTQYYLANTLSFARSFAEKTHNIGVVLTQSFDFKDVTDAHVGGYNIPSDNIQVVSGVPQQDLYGYSNFKQSGLLSFLGQVSYDFKEKYILNASWRADASSRFGENTKWGYFPSVSIAWIASDEKFLTKASWINLLKFRASYGLSGTEPDDFYAPYNVWASGVTTYGGIPTSTPSFEKPITLKNLTWNKANQLNVGVDLYTFKNRINLSVDLYRKENFNPIQSFDFPFFTGYERLKYNAPVSILNEGVDVQLKTRNLPTGKAFQWETWFNLNYNKNRLSKLPNGNRTFYADSRGYNERLLFQVGKPIYSWAQMIYTGVYNNKEQIPINPLTGQPITYFKTYVPVRPGFPIWRDTNGDWDVWSDEDRGEATGDLVMSGDPNPKFTGGLYNEFTYKNFSLGVQCTYTLGRDIINTYESNQYAGIWNFGGLQAFGNQRLPDLRNVHYWRRDMAAKDKNYTANFPELNIYGANYYQFLPFSTMWNESGDYFRIKSVTMGYTLPQNISRRLKINNARLFSTIDNLYIFQKAHVPDAELVSPQGEYNGSSYPLPKKFTLGLEVTF